MILKSLSERFNGVATALQFRRRLTTLFCFIASTTPSSHVKALQNAIIYHVNRTIQTYIPLNNGSILWLVRNNANPAFRRLLPSGSVILCQSLGSHCYHVPCKPQAGMPCAGTSWNCKQIYWLVTPYSRSRRVPRREYSR